MRPTEIVGDGGDGGAGFLERLRYFGGFYSQRRSTVDRFLQPLPGLELGLSGGGDLHGLAGTGIAAFSGCAVSDIEGAKPGQTDIVALSQSIGNNIEGAIDGTGSVRFGDAGGGGNGGDEVGFVYFGPPAWS
jgi:hypothetical protein